MSLDALQSVKYPSFRWFLGFRFCSRGKTAKSFLGHPRAFGDGSPDKIIFPNFRLLFFEKKTAEKTG